MDLWSDRVRAMLAEEGVVARTEDEVERLVPEEVLAARGTLDESATEVDIVAHCDQFVPYTEVLTGLILDLEVETLAYVARLIDERRPRIVLDAGCGVGITTVVLARLFPNVYFVGTDISRKSTKAARRRARERKTRNVSIIPSAHAELFGKLPAAMCDLVFTRFSFDAGSVVIPDFWMEPGTTQEINRFLVTPVMQRWSASMRNIEGMLSPRGMYVHILLTRDHQSDLYAEIAHRAVLTETGERHEFRSYAGFDDWHPRYLQRVRAQHFIRSA